MKPARVSENAAIAAAKTFGAFLDGDSTVTLKGAKAAHKVMTRFCAEREKAVKDKLRQKQKTTAK